MAEPGLDGIFGHVLVTMNPFQAGEKMDPKTEVVTNSKIAPKMVLLFVMGYLFIVFS